MNKRLIMIMGMILLVSTLIFGFIGTSNSFDVWNKYDFGTTANASSISFTNRFIMGNQPVSSYNSTSFSGRFGIMTETNNAPEVENVLLVSINGANETDSDLNCSFSVLDIDLDLMNVTLRWHESGDVVDTIELEDNYLSGSTINEILDSSNLEVGDIWRCSVRVYDGKGYSEWYYSNEVEIIDLTNPSISIISPLNITYNSLVIDFNVTLDEEGSWCGYSLDGGANISMNKVGLYNFTSQNSSMNPGSHTIMYSCNDTSNNFDYVQRTFYISNDAAISIQLSPELSQRVLWNIHELPVTDLNASGNNGTGASEYYLDISATNTDVDIYIRANSDLLTEALDVIGLGNETFAYNLTDESVPSPEMQNLSTNFTLVAGGLGDGDRISLKFWLDVSASQAPGEYSNILEFKAVRGGQQV
jgi:hypothetical protein